MRVTVSIPDGAFAEAAILEADSQQRSVPNLCLYALRILLNKHGHKIAQIDSLKRGRGKGRPPVKKNLQTSATTANDDSNGGI